MSRLIIGLCTTVFSLFKTCLRAARRRLLIRRHVDRQAGVIHSTASVVNNSRSVCEQWAEPGLRMPSKHVESDHRPRHTKLQRPELSTEGKRASAGLLACLPDRSHRKPSFLSAVKQHHVRSPVARARWLNAVLKVQEPNTESTRSTRYHTWSRRLSGQADPNVGCLEKE